MAFQSSDRSVKWIVGNWKMTGRGADVDAWCQAVATGAAGLKSAKSAKSVVMGFAPPFPYVARATQQLKSGGSGESGVAVGGQTCASVADGAVTGEVSAAMLTDCGASFVLVGHSERRQSYGETDDMLKAKAKQAWDAGLHVLFCVGETEAEREAGAVERVLKRQVQQGLALNEWAQRGGEPLAKCLTIAYEPVWAIGTGKAAAPEDAQRVHAALRTMVAAELPANRQAEANQLRLLYGGSVKPANAGTFLAMADVDGALVGGASQQAESFLAIAQAA